MGETGYQEKAIYSCAIIDYDGFRDIDVDYRHSFERHSTVI